MVGKDADNNVEKIFDGSIEMKNENEKLFLPKQSREVNDLFSYLQKRDAEQLYLLLGTMYNSDDRIMYSLFTQKVYGTQGDLTEILEWFLTEFILKYCRIKLEEEKTSSSERSSEFLKFVYKIYDHIMLASTQVNVLQKNIESELKGYMDRKKDELSTRIDGIDSGIQEQNDKLTELQKKLSGLKDSLFSQIITILGIFTAIAFVVFGGLSSLDNIFEGITDIPLLKIIILSLLWALAFFNTVFVFMYFLDKLVKENGNTESFLKKYKMVVILECTLVVLLVIFCIFYFCSLSASQYV